MDTDSHQSLAPCAFMCIWYVLGLVLLIGYVTVWTLLALYLDPIVGFTCLGVMIMLIIGVKQY